MLNDTLIVIPSRLNSTRLPNKPLLEIHGHPMVYWVANRIRKANICDYLVATDSNEIENVCKQENINVVMTSPDCKNGTERVAEVSKKFNYKYFCNVQGDEPLINIAGVKDFILKAKKHKNAFVQAITETQKNTNDTSEVKVSVDDKKRIRYLSRLSIPYIRNQKSNLRHKCLGLYLYDRTFISSFIKLREGYLEKAECIEQLRCIENDLVLIAEKVDFDSISVDTSSDLKYVRSIKKEHFERLNH